MRNYLLVIASILMFTSVDAQISQGGTPNSWQNKINDIDVPFLKTATLDMQSINAEDAVVDQYKETPYRFGVDLDVDYNFFEEATYSTVENGDRIWKLGVHCPEATSVNFLFGLFDLAEGGALFVYDEGKTELLGAFTEENEKSYGSLAIGLIHSDRIIIEYREPSDFLNQSSLVISQISHGYRPVINKWAVDKGPFGNSGSCNMNVNCSDGDPWQNEKRGVALILNGGSSWCTGSLINTTNQDGTPYFLTAAHCNANENNWVFYFNHEYSGCSNSGSAPTNQSISGGTQVASTSPSDAHLVLLSSDVPASYQPYYNGWDRSGSAVSSAVGIHHPAGDVKKISFDDDACQKTSYLSSNTSSTGNHWRIEAWERNTTTEGGSSGSPLFDQNHRIIGQLHGGFASCTTTGDADQDWYGAMQASWSTLDNFLAPGNSSITTLDGFDPAASGPSDFNLKTMLQGPYQSASGDMNDLLRQSGNIPTTEPFTNLGFNHVNGGGETTTNAVLNTTGANAIVDWIFVELRSESNPATIIYTQSALLQRDGDIVDVDGTSPVTFDNLSETAVFVALRHRNHLGMRTSSSISTSSEVNVDFTSTSVALFGTDAMETIGGTRVMISGNANGDSQVNSIDKNINWRAQNGELFIYNTSNADFDLNGTVNSLDKNLQWRLNNSKLQQLD